MQLIGKLCNNWPSVAGSALYLFFRVPYAGPVPLALVFYSAYRESAADILLLQRVCLALPIRAGYNAVPRILAADYMYICCTNSVHRILILPLYIFVQNLPINCVLLTLNGNLLNSR